MAKKKVQVMFIPGKGKKKGSIVVRNRRGALVVRIPVKPSFDPGTIFFDAYCCKTDFSDCKLRKAGENCANTDRPTTAWY